MLPPTLAPPPAAPLRAATSRVLAIDVVRGLAMVIMALDHIREFWSPTPVRAEDVAHASVLLFGTRWITHFCAPTFVFLAGTSVFLSQQKRASRGVASRFLLTRGLWLIVLEIVVISFILHWNYDAFLLQVIWAMGWSMLLLAGLIWLPRGLLAAVALAFLAGQHLLPQLQPVTAANLLPALLYDRPFQFDITPALPVLVAYTVLPWTAVMAVGYCIGPWFRAPLGQRQRWLQWAGTGALVLFAGLRFTNLYGDPAPWSVQPRGPLYTLLSFVNITKYPPSLLFLCLMLGLALLLLSVSEGGVGRLGRWLSTYGRVPMFYYLLHLCLISGGSYIRTALAFGHPYNLSFPPTGVPQPAAYQPSLLRAYVVWVVVVTLLYWPCRWYQGYKQRHAHWWLSYL